MLKIIHKWNFSAKNGSVFGFEAHFSGSPCPYSPFQGTVFPMGAVIIHPKVPLCNRKMEFLFTALLPCG
jgi:hypothetical protein